MIRRAFDLVASGLGLVILSPFFLLTAFAIKVTDFGPVIFTQLRVGRDGRPFRMCKFRSMRVGAERMGPAITVGRDPRVTAIGHVLRKLKLDEFPQLWNVVKGEMALVGPRPEVARYVDQYTPEDRAVLSLTPGITDPASFAYYDESAVLAAAQDPERFYVRHLMPAKIRLNLAYAARRTFASDLLLIVATVLKPFGVHINIFKRLNLIDPREITT